MSVRDLTLPDTPLKKKNVGHGVIRHLRKELKGRFDAGSITDECCCGVEESDYVLGMEN